MAAREPRLVALVPPVREAESPRVTPGDAGFALLGAIAGASVFLDGYYDFAVWGALTLAALAALVMAIMLWHRRPAPVATIALGALLALTGFALLSMLWADSVDRAWVESSRLALYLAVAGLAMLVVRSRRHATVLLGALAASIVVMALLVLARMHAGDSELFLRHRLHEPLGYVNGMAGCLLMGLWPLVIAAQRARSAALAGAALAGAALIVNLIVLTQSRAAVPAIVGSAVLLLLAFPGRTRRFWALALVLLSAAAAAKWSLAVYASGDVFKVGRPAPDLVRAAAVAITLSCLAAGIAWAGLCRLATRSGHALPRRLAATLAAAVVLLVPAGGLVAIGNPVAAVQRQWDSFTGLAFNTENASRFGDASGQRYDLWRVAMSQFESEPLRGVGAGNYGLQYFQQRGTTDPVRQPHSLELQLLAELGIIGLLILLVFAGAVTVAAVRPFRGMVLSDSSQLRAAALGIFSVWLLHTSIDWLYNIPGVTAMAMIAAGCLLAGRSDHGHRRHTRRMALAGVTIAVALLAASVGRLYVADRYRAEAASVVETDPVAALDATDRALALNSQSMAALYLRAAAFARLDRYVQSRTTLLEATRVERYNYVPWALLGDLAVRRGDRAFARKAYLRALQLNPRDTVLQALYYDPKLAP